MTLVATLIANPASPGLTRSLANSAADAAGARSIDWLADGVACDLAFSSGADRTEIGTALRKEVGDRPVDIVVQGAEGRRKKLQLADMDSTMIAQECIDELADMLGLKAHVAAITARAMNGEIAFEPALRERVALLEGLPVGVIEEVIESRITLSPGALALVRTMKRHGAYTILVSGGFTAFTGPVAAKIGFDEHRANDLVAVNGVLAGRVVEPILGRRAKRDMLFEAAARLMIHPADSIAVGDGANDLDMLLSAGTGVALHARPAVAEAAPVRVDHGDLTALLYIQGYRAEDFAR
jgi:phosphoserine phosphatase